VVFGSNPTLSVDCRALRAAVGFGSNPTLSVALSYRFMFFRSAPTSSTGIPPSVGTMITMLSDPFMSCSTSRYCLVSCSGVSVRFSNRC